MRLRDVRRLLQRLDHSTLPTLRPRSNSRNSGRLLQSRSGSARPVSFRRQDREDQTLGRHCRCSPVQGLQHHPRHRSQLPISGSGRTSGEHARALLLQQRALDPRLPGCLHRQAREVHPRRALPQELRFERQALLLQPLVSDRQLRSGKYEQISQRFWPFNSDQNVPATPPRSPAQSSTFAELAVEGKLDLVQNCSHQERQLRFHPHFQFVKPDRAGLEDKQI